MYTGNQRILASPVAKYEDGLGWKLRAPGHIGSLTREQKGVPTDAKPRCYILLSST